MSNSSEVKIEGHSHSASPRKISSAQFILMSLFAGIVVGIFFGEIAGRLQFIGDIFIKLLQITVIPYISLALITGLGGLQRSVVSGLAKKGGLILVLVWTIASIFVFLAPLAFPDWPSASYFSPSLTEPPQSPDYLRMFIPSNPFYSYANAIVPAVVVFSVLVGISLIGIDGKEAILRPLEVLRDALMKITGFVSKLAPIGVFALLASAAGTIDLGELSRLQIYIIVYAMLATILALWILPTLVAALTPLRYGNILRALRTPLVTSFATGSSLIVLPMLIDQCKLLIGESQQRTLVITEPDQPDQPEPLKDDEVESPVEVLIPTAYPFLSPATLLTLIFLLFGGWSMGSAIAPSDYPMMLMAGIPSLFAGSIIAMPFLLDLLKLPQDLFQVFVSVDVITVRFGTMLSAMHYSVVALVGTFFLSGKQHIQWRAIIKLVVASSILITSVLFGVRAFYTHVVVAPYTKADVMMGLQLKETATPAIVHTALPSSLPQQTEKLASMPDIFERGILKACYQPNEYPSAFYNTATPRSLVGFDIEMAHRMASALQVTLEFFPTVDEAEAADALNAGICDVYMRTLPITPGRTNIFGLTLSVYTSSVGFIVRDYRRREFNYWNSLLARGEELNIAIDASRESQFSARNLLPDATITLLRDMNEQAQLLEKTSNDVDAVMDMAEEGAAWSVMYPQYSVVVPRPAIFVPVAYAVAKGNDDLLAALNAHLLLMKENGFVDQNYEYWMLGGAAKSDRPPRWSVIKDVLKWVD